MKNCDNCKHCSEDGILCSALRNGRTRFGGCSYYKRDIMPTSEAKLREELGMTRMDVRSHDYTRRDERYDEELEYIE